MKWFLLVCALGLIGVTVATPVHPPPETNSRGCIYINGHCSRECEVGTRAYTTGCGYLTREATCEEPNPVEDRRGHICDYSACYCESPTVRDPVSKKCVPLDQCPKKDQEKVTL